MGVDWKKTKGCCDSISLSPTQVLLCSNFQYDYTDTGIVQQVCIHNGRRISNILEKECLQVRALSLFPPAPSQEISSQEIFLSEKNLKNFHTSGNGQFNRRISNESIDPSASAYLHRLAPCRAVPRGIPPRYYLVRCVHVRSFYSQGRSRKISGDKRD